MHAEVFHDGNSGARLKSTLSRAFFENEMQTPTTATGAAQLDVKEIEKLHRVMSSDDATC